MTESSFVVLRVRGIPIGAHWSWLFVFALVVWSLTSFLFPSTYPGLAGSTYLIMGFVAGILFFVSILLHELGHAFRALTEGMEIDGITLWLFGGVARFKGMFKSPSAEFRIAIAGPVVSFVIAAVFGALALLGAAGDAPDPLLGVVDYLWRINALVLGFNLVPALPLDGGRVLRSYLWHRQRSFAAATRSAASAGRIFGGMLIALGLLDFLTGGGGAGGLWFVFLGWFLIQAAQSEASMVLVYQVLGPRRVRDLMTPNPASVTADLTITDFFDEVVEEHGHSSYPVIEGGEVVGLISLRRAGTIPRDERSLKRVRDAMYRGDEVTVLSPEVGMVEVMDRLDTEPKRIPVVEDGRLVGILSISDVVRALEIEQARGPGDEPTSRRAGLLVWLVVATAILVVAGFLYRPPLVVLSPGVTLDVSQDISITGTTVDRNEGEYLLTSVRLERRNALGLLFTAVTSDDEIVSAAELVPEGTESEEFARQQREIFRQSQVLAAAAAARATGMDVAIEGAGAVVEDVIPASPAAGNLRSGDVIVEVNDTRVGLATDLQSILRSRPAGTRFAVTIERGGERMTIEIRTARLSAASETIVGLGVVVSTRDFEVNLPFDVEFRERAIGGPSAGLIYALAIADMLEPADLARGRTIAASGTIDVDGGVGAIGGVEAKADAVIDAGGDIFFVPEGQVDLVRVEGLDVRGIARLEEALRALRS